MFLLKEKFGNCSERHYCSSSSRSVVRFSFDGSIEYVGIAMSTIAHLSGLFNYTGLIIHMGALAYLIAQIVKVFSWLAPSSIAGRTALIKDSSF